MIELPTQHDVLTYKSPYGDPRNKRDPSKASPAWEAENLVPYSPPFQMFYGGQKLRALRFHKLAVPHFELLFNGLFKMANGNQETLNKWGVSKTGGAYNYRLMRGLGTLSMHAFGCAVDLDPANNGLGDSTPRFAEFPQVIQAFRESGLCWGGDWDGDGSSADQRRHDGMHLQATQKIKG